VSRPGISDDCAARYGIALRVLARNGFARRLLPRISDPAAIHRALELLTADLPLESPERTTLEAVIAAGPYTFKSFCARHAEWARSVIEEVTTCS